MLQFEMNRIEYFSNIYNKKNVADPAALPLFTHVARGGLLRFPAALVPVAQPEIAELSTVSASNWLSWTLDRDTAPTAPAQRIRPAASGGSAASGSDLEACLPLLNCRLGKVQREHEQCLADLCRFRSFSEAFLNYYNLSLHKRDSYVKLIKCLV